MLRWKLCDVSFQAVPWQVSTYWQWLRFCAAQVPAAKNLLFLNLDETSVQYTPESLQGLVVTKRHWGRRWQGPYAYVGHADRRGSVTYVAIVCDRTGIQPSIPHFILGNEHKFTRGLLGAAGAHCPSNVYLWRQVSAWNNKYVMVRILKHLHNSMRPWLATFQPVLLLDVAPCHLDPMVMKQAARLGIWLVYIPAKVTSLLQPLDTHGFAAFKTWLRRGFQELRSASPDGQVAGVEWVKLLRRASAEFFAARSWAKSFKQTGACEGENLTKCLQMHVGSLKRPAGPAEPLLAEDLEVVWPKRRRMAHAHRTIFDAILQQDSTQEQAGKGPLAAGARRPGLGSVVRQEPAVSVALSSRSNARACRRYPVRS